MNGTLWASDPNWAASTGQIWRIDRKGHVTKAASGMGTTNGIEVSPDGRTLYVNESHQRKVWAFRIERGGSLVGKRLLLEFPDFGMDGMRTDVDGNLYITRHGRGTVAVVSPAGQIVKEVDVLGKNPTNICFGGPDGRTAYVTEAEQGRLVQFRTDRPGLEWQRQHRYFRRGSGRAAPHRAQHRARGTDSGDGPFEKSVMTKHVPRSFIRMLHA